MAPLATAFIRLRSDSSQLTGDIRRDAAKAGATGGTVAGREFGTAFRRATHVLIGLGLGTFAVEAGRFALEMADKFELSRSRIETVTKNLGGNFDAVSGQVQALDDRLAAFGFTNADVEGSVASLETATKSLPKALNDVALAADIARGRNISLESATLILMRVETGHVAMLSRLGIATKDANGHILSQRQALQELAQVYGGSASHFADTFAGKQQALRAELGNSAAEIGVALLPAMVDLARVVQHDVLPPIEHAAQFFDRNRKTIEPLVGTIIKLVLAYKAIKLAQKGLQAFRLAGAAGAAETGALSVASMAKPIPVFVTNEGFGKLPGGGGGGGSKPPIVVPKVSKATVADAEVGAGVGVGLRGRPVVGTDSLKIASVTAQVAATGAGAAALIRQLPAAMQAQARKDLAGAYSTVATGSGFHKLLFGPSFKTEIDTAKVKALEAQWSKLVPAVNKGATAETHAGAATKGATRSLQDQAKALGNAQTKSLALSSAQDALRSAVHNMATTAGAGGWALKGNSDAALANRDALRGAVQSAEGYIGTLKAQHVNQQYVAATAVALAKAIRTNATATYGNKAAVDAMLKSLHFLPGQMENALGSTVAAAERIGEGIMQALALGIRNETPVAVQQAKIAASQTLKVARLAAGLDSGTGVAGSLIPDAPKAQKIGVDFLKSITAGYTPVVDAGIAAASKAAATKAQQAFDAAQQKMRADFQTIKQYYSQQKQSLESTFGSLNLTPATDSLGASFAKATSIKAQLRGEARQMDTFAHLYKRLANEHLDPRLLAQLEGLGPDAIPSMRELLKSGRKGIRQVDRLERRIARDAGGIAASDTSSRYGSLIHHDLEHLPRRFASEFAQELRRLNVVTDTTSTARKHGKRVRAS